MIKINIKNQTLLLLSALVDPNKQGMHEVRPAAAALPARNTTLRVLLPWLELSMESNPQHQPTMS
jgi:hypothetical protein